MEWWQAIILGIVQGLTEFLPVSSSGHLMIFKEILGADGEGFLDFTVAVHFATVLATIVVFWSVIVNLFKGFFKFKYNDETDYVCKILVSLIPVALVGFLFKDQVEYISKIITGEYDLDKFDEFVDRWYKNGGEAVTERVRAWYAGKQ